jgi:hypothetical protein
MLAGFDLAWNVVDELVLLGCFSQLGDVLTALPRSLSYLDSVQRRPQPEWVGDQVGGGVRGGSALCCSGTGAFSPPHGI